MGVTKSHGARRWARRFTTALVVTALMVPATPVARADSQSDLQKAQAKLDAIRKQSKDAQNALASLNAQAAEAQAQLEVIEQELAQANAAYEVVANETIQATNHLKQVEAELAATKERYAARKEVVADRLRSLQENGRVSYLEVIFGASNFSDFISRVEMMTAIVRKDREVFDEVKKEKALLEEQQREAAARKTQLEALQAKALATKQEVEQRRNEREQVSRSLAASRSRLLAQLEEYDQAASRINEEIARLQEQMQTPSNGEFSPILPVRAPAIVTSLFGPRLHPILGTWRQHNGVDFNAPTGTPIMAVESGTVIVARWDDAFGNYIVIDHGGGIATLYAHNSQLLVSVGQKVTKGQQIAAAGSTGWSTGPHCHIEIHVNGVPQNFLNYVPKGNYTIMEDA
jgi:murein DD-endopeptidase MepM/ murein hydrolase activator NlpD